MTDRLKAEIAWRRAFLEWYTPVYKSEVENDDEDFYYFDEMQAAFKARYEAGKKAHETTQPNSQ